MNQIGQPDRTIEPTVSSSESSCSTGIQDETIHERNPMGNDKTRQSRRRRTARTNDAFDPCLSVMVGLFIVLAEEFGGIEGEEFGKGHARGADDQRGGGAEPAAELREAVGRGFGVGFHLDRGEPFAAAQDVVHLKPAVMPQSAGRAVFRTSELLDFARDEYFTQFGAQFYSTTKASQAKKEGLARREVDCPGINLNLARDGRQVPAAASVVWSGAPRRTASRVLEAGRILHTFRILFRLRRGRIPVHSQHLRLGTFPSLPAQLQPLSSYP